MVRYSINDLEKITGIKAHTIRIWEKRYKVVCPNRTPTNIRYYTDQDLLRLLNISTLNKYGFKISEIVKMPREEICEKITDISRSATDFESQINYLTVAMMELNEDTFEKVLSSTILKIGFEKTVTHVLYPLLEKIGILWQIGTINPAQEHFLSNLIRQKMIVAIDGQQQTKTTSSKTFLLYLPEMEFHEIGLLFFNYLIKKAGHQVVYLGQNVPFNDMAEVSKIRKPEYVLTYFVSAFQPKEVSAYLNKMAETLADKQILLSGIQARELPLHLAENMTLIKSAEALKEFLKKIN